VVAPACRATYTADVNQVSGSTTSGIVRRRAATLAEPISGSWTRVADTVSEAQIVVDTGGDCGQQLADLAPYLGYLELVLFRDGVQVWAGPITGISQDRRGDPATITGADIAWWIDEQRAITGNPNWTSTGDVAAVAQAALTQILTTGPDPARYRRDSGLIMAHWDFDTVGTSIAYVNTDRFADGVSILTELVDYGLTWTVANYRLLVGPRPPIDATPVEIVGPGDFDAPVQVQMRAEDLVTVAWGASSADDLNASVHVAGLQLPRLTAVIDAGDVTAPASLRAAALPHLNWPARPTVATPSGKMLRAPDFAKAIPGRVVWNVVTEALGYRFEQPMHLESIQVDFAIEGPEDIKPGLTPIGTATAVEP
jgi:hypothetical protein